MRWYVLVSAVCMSACASPKMIDTGAVAIVAPESLPAPTLADLSRGQYTHLVGPFDQIFYSQDLIVVGESQGRPLFSQRIQRAGLLFSPVITVLGNKNS